MTLRDGSRGCSPLALVLSAFEIGPSICAVRAASSVNISKRTKESGVSS